MKKKGNIFTQILHWALSYYLLIVLWWEAANLLEINSGIRTPVNFHMPLSQQARSSTPPSSNELTQLESSTVITLESLIIVTHSQILLLQIQRPDRLQGVDIAPILFSLNYRWGMPELASIHHLTQGVIDLFTSLLQIVSHTSPNTFQLKMHSKAIPSRNYPQMSTILATIQACIMIETWAELRGHLKTRKDTSKLPAALVMKYMTSFLLWAIMGSICERTSYPLPDYTL